MLHSRRKNLHPTKSGGLRSCKSVVIKEWGSSTLGALQKVISSQHNQAQINYCVGCIMGGVPAVRGRGERSTAKFLPRCFDI